MAYRNINEQDINELYQAKTELLERIRQAAHKERDLRHELMEKKKQLEDQEKIIKELTAELELAQAPVPSAVRPPTGASVQGPRIEYELDRDTIPQDPHDFDLIPDQVAARYIQGHRDNNSTITTIGCWLSRAAQGHPNGYVRPNLRNTIMADGRKHNIQVWLHQLALLSTQPARRNELKASLRRPGETTSEYQVSHLCHHGNCFNPAHLVVEKSWENKARNTCQGHYVIKHDGMTWHPCRHHKTGVHQRCILPVNVLGNGYYENA